MVRRVRFVCLLLLAPVWCAGALHAAPLPTSLKLVLQITVDQLRGDLLPRFHKRFGQGGFRLLMEHGVYYANANYQTANTVTCAGHAVLVTGADTGEHGIPANDWYDRATGHNVYCVQDARYPALGEPVVAGAGLSPVNLTSSTVGDELVSATGGQSRAFAIAGKDRSAIIPGGHRGKAFWYSSVGGMASSRYYYQTLPAWVQQWNDRKNIVRYREQGWTLARPADSYLNRANAGNEFAHPKAATGAGFPHLLNNGGDAGLVAAIPFTPFLDELTEAFAQELITREHLGGNGVADYLSISFSSTDYIGHTFGPNSVEAEDNLVHLDATLARLFTFIDKTIGLQNTLIVLSADHGVDDIPEALRAAGYQTERFGGDAFKAKLNALLRQRLGIAEDVVASVLPPNIYLDAARVQLANIDMATADNAMAAVLRAEPGIAYVFTRAELMAGGIGSRPLLERVQRAFHPQRSGDVVAIQQQFYYFDDKPDYYATTHGSPYSYDTYVPVIVLAPGVQAMTSYEPVAPAQIAPTLSALLGIKPPSGCVCEPPLPHLLPP